MAAVPAAARLEVSVCLFVYRGGAARLAAVLAVAALAAGCATGRAALTRPSSGSSAAGSSAQAVGVTSFPAGHRPVPPEVSGTSLTGTPLRLPGGYHGRVVVLNFWAS